MLNIPAYRKSKNDAALEKQKKAFEISHDIRKFEIDLYWKRANFFWGIQAAVFTGIGFGKSLDDDLAVFLVPLGLLGFSISVLSYFAAKGAKFWQENWEINIDIIENNITSPLYKKINFYNNTDNVYSVSKIYESVCLIFILFWIIVVTVLLPPNISTWLDYLPDDRMKPFYVLFIGFYGVGLLSIVFSNTPFKNIFKILSEIDYPKKEQIGHVLSGNEKKVIYCNERQVEK